MPGPIIRAAAAARYLVRLPELLRDLDARIGRLLERLEAAEALERRRPAIRTPLDVFERATR